LKARVLNSAAARIQAIVSLSPETDLAMNRVFLIDLNSSPGPSAEPAKEGVSASGEPLIIFEGQK
jgi:hypothetical protein